MVPKKGKNLVLFLSSLFFYAWGEPIYIFLMLFNASVDYLAGRLIERYEEHPAAKKAALLLSLVVNQCLDFSSMQTFLLEA
ncbi:MAG: hypothetical protein ACOCM8_10465 [Acetivibrio ethanolgignens]